MKNRLLYLLLMLLGSCATPKYLPAPTEVGSSPYGSYIRIDRKQGSGVKGELIAVTENQVLILTREGDPIRLQTIPIPEIRNYDILYARPKHYGWSIPVYTLFTLSHGFYSLFTAPANLITTSIVTGKGENAYRIKRENLSLDQLKMYARFPQGIPENIDSSQIK